MARLAPRKRAPQPPTAALSAEAVVAPDYRSFSLIDSRVNYCGVSLDKLRNHSDKCMSRLILRRLFEAGELRNDRIADYEWVELEGVRALWAGPVLLSKRARSTTTAIDSIA